MTSSAPESSHERRAVAGDRPPPAEVTEVHTRILRCMLAVEDSDAYWRRADLDVPLGERANVAFEQRWFGTKSEARVRTIMTDMIERFDAFPESLLLFRDLGAIPARLRPFICHVHVQLSDPIYRAFTGDLLPARRREGRTTLDRAAVARWIDDREPGRWAPATAMKFASNLLATAFDVGLVQARRDPRKLVAPSVPNVILAYVLYVLRDVQFEGTLLDNPYVRSFGIEAPHFGAYAPRVPGIRFAQLGAAADVDFEERSIHAWGMRALREAA